MGKSQPVFIAGNDEAGVRKAARAEAARLAPGADAFGIETIDGAVEVVDAAVGRVHDTMNALQTMPFLGGTKLVWLKSATFLSDSVVGRSESVLAAVESLVGLVSQPLPDGVQFLMSAIDPDKRRSGFKQLSKISRTQIIDRPSLGFGAGEEELSAWVAGQLHERGILADSEAVDALAARVGLDPAQLDCELDKIETALGAGHTLSASDVRALVPATRAGGIFDLGNAIQSRNLPLALDTLDQLVRQREAPISILLASVVPTVRNLLLAKDLMARHRIEPPSKPQFFASALNRIPSSETAYLPKKKDGTLNSYGLGLAAMASVHYTSKELFRAFQLCAETNLRLVTSQSDAHVALARLLIGFMAR